MSDIEKRISLLRAYQTTFESDSGKQVLLDLMKNNHMLTTDFSNDPLRNAYNEGERSVVLRILNKLKIDHRKYKQYLDNNVTHEQLFEGDI